MPELSRDVITRVDFALLCNELRITTGIEVGTDVGTFADDFLTRWTGTLLICIDPYEPYPECPFDRSGDFAMAVQVLAKHRGRAKIVRERSIDAAHGRRFPAFLEWGFIYIDADHSYEAAKADLAAWWPILNDDGVFAGHDYDDAHPGVVQAVDEFAKAHGLSVYLTHDKPASWYVRKPPKAEAQ